jgi:hypothetical protein
MCAHRLNPWDLDDVAPDEELPGYEAATTPAYDNGSYDEPLIVYHLRQYDRRIQMLVAQGEHIKSSYRITSNNFKIFSKKPDMEVLFTSQEMRQRNIAVIGFDNHGPLPWCPRAHFDHTGSDGTKTSQTMEAKDFTNWALSLDGTKYGWTLYNSPFALVFHEQESSIPIARFMYSACGTTAARGAEIGELTVFRDGLTLGPKGVDYIVCSLMVTITHLKRLGRRYTNADSDLVRAISLSRESIPVHRASVGGYSMI